MLIIPTGILTVAFLTRNLGPAGYGVLALTTAIGDWLEWGVAASFSRATVKFVSEAEDWRPVATRAIQLQFVASAAVALLLAAVAGPLAGLLNESALAHYLRLYALHIPVFCLVQAHRDVLVGLGYFRERAIGSGWRWVFRFAFIVLLVKAGLAIDGAIIGSLASLFVELAIYRWYAKPGLFVTSGIMSRPFLAYVGPLSLYTVSVKLYERLDLLTFKALGATAAAAGIYSSAEGIASLPTIFAAAFSPMILSALVQSVREGRLETARQRGRQALRAMLLMVPLAGILPGISVDLVGTLYGDAFLPAAPIFNVMIFGSIALFFIAVLTSIMVAAGQPGWTFRVMGPLVVLQLVADLIVIPRFGALGAAYVTALSASAGCLACIVVVRHLWGIIPPLPTFLRGAALAIGGYAAAVSWHTPGLLVFGKFVVLAAGVVAVYWFFDDLPGARQRSAVNA